MEAPAPAPDMEASTLSEVIELPQGQVSYRVAGPRVSDRPPVVFLHGLLVDGRLWAPVADLLAQQGVRSYAPTLPMGAHPTPMRPDADITPRGIARLALDLIAALDLQDVTLVGNDTGGAIAQFALDTDPARIGRAVLTNCDAFDVFPPRPLAPLIRALRHPAVVAAMVPGLRSTRLRHGPLAFGPLADRPLDPALTGTWVKPLTDRSIRRDLAKLARGINPKDLLDVSTRLGQIAAPVRVLWGDGDPYFRVELGRRLADAFAHATFETVVDGRAFLPLDHPDRVAATILGMP